MDYPKVVVSNQKEGPISIQRVKSIIPRHALLQFLSFSLVSVAEQRPMSITLLHTCKTGLTNTHYYNSNLIWCTVSHRVD